jgi:hypothetical protein
MLRKTQAQPTPTLEERIKAHREEMDKCLADAAATEKKTCEGVPEIVLRRLYENQAPGCMCRQVLKLLEQGK